MYIFVSFPSYSEPGVPVLLLINWAGITNSIRLGALLINETIYSMNPSNTCMCQEGKKQSCTGMQGGHFEHLSQRLLGSRNGCNLVTKQNWTYFIVL